MFVHAGLADRRMWDRQFARLAADRRVIRYDWRGYGGFDSGPAGEVARHRDLLALLDALRVERAVPVRALALEMCRGVFARLWSDPVLEERDGDPPALGRLAEVGVPTLVVTGLADVPAVSQIADLLSGGIAGARRIDLPDTGHLPPLERPDEVTGALLDLLAEVDGRLSA